MHRLPSHPITTGHIRHPGPAQYLQHRLESLLHNTQLHQHTNLLRDLSEEHEPSGVAQQPEPASPNNRNRVPNLEPTNRSHNVHHEPKQDSS